MAKPPSIEIYIGGHSQHDALLRSLYDKLTKSGRGRAQSFFRMALMRGVLDLQDFWPNEFDISSLDDAPRVRVNRNKSRKKRRERINDEVEKIFLAPILEEDKNDLIEEKAEQEILSSSEREPSKEDHEASNEDSFIFTPDFEIEKEPNEEEIKEERINRIKNIM